MIYRLAFVMFSIRYPCFGVVRSQCIIPVSSAMAYRLFVPVVSSNEKHAGGIDGEVSINPQASKWTGTFYLDVSISPTYPVRENYPLHREYQGLT